MSFALKMSLKTVQTKIDQTFEGCKGVVGIADDFVVSWETTEEHEHNMHAMLKRCIDTTVKLNPEKCFVKQEKIKFHRVIFGQECIQLDTSKLSALKQMCTPYKSPGTVELSWASRLHGFIYSKPTRTDSPAS